MAEGHEDASRTEAYLAERQSLIAAVTRSDGSLAPQIRQAIVDRGRGRQADEPIPLALRSFVDIVATNASSIEDAHVEPLTDQGFDDEALFETIVAAALGASLVRLERVDELLGVD